MQNRPYYVVLYMQSVHIMQCVIYKVSLMCSVLYTKFPYIVVLCMQSVLENTEKRSQSWASFYDVLIRMRFGCDVAWQAGQLVGMGFPARDAMAALGRSGGDIAAAIEALLTSAQ